LGIEGCLKEPGNKNKTMKKMEKKMEGQFHWVVATLLQLFE
jgi:hypothetical protein